MPRASEQQRQRLVWRGFKPLFEGIVEHNEALCVMESVDTLHICIHYIMNAFVFAVRRHVFAVRYRLTYEESVVAPWPHTGLTSDASTIRAVEEKKIQRTHNDTKKIRVTAAYSFVPQPELLCKRKPYEHVDTRR
jgi:hypothetical protein